MSLWCFSGLSESFRNPPGTWYAGPKAYQSSGSSDWTGMHSLTRNECSLHDQNLFVENIKKNLFVEELNGSDFITHKLTDARLDGNSGVKDLTCEDRFTTDRDVQAVTAPSLREAQVCVLQSTFYASIFTVSFLYNSSF